MAGFEKIAVCLRERGVYNASVHFPILGSRLLDLADYSMSQRPRNLVEVWNDQRDPERLLTFKALVIFGGLALLLGLIQTLLGVAQLVLAARE